MMRGGEKQSRKNAPASYALGAWRGALDYVLNAVGPVRRPKPAPRLLLPPSYSHTALTGNARRRRISITKSATSHICPVTAD
jgi:hypothetical protein